MNPANGEEMRSGPRSLRHPRAAASTEQRGHIHPTGALPGLILGAVGIVFGDIGTSPLYAFKECITGEHPMPATAGNVLGVLSLIVWSLTLVVTVKYLVFVMRADNEGEGGILALLALTPERMRGRGRSIGLGGWPSGNRGAPTGDPTAHEIRAPDPHIRRSEALTCCARGGI